MKDKNKLIKNIYYMLSYAFKNLDKKEFNKVELEEFDYIDDLYSFVLTYLVSKQLKKSLIKEYVEINDITSNIKGRININESIKKQTMVEHELYCFYDEFNVNSYFNRIIKTALNLLIKSNKVKLERKNELKKIIVYFNDIELLDVHSIRWIFKYNRNNKDYEFIINVCFLVINGYIQSENNGKKSLYNFFNFNEHFMSWLFENFVRNYIDNEFKDINVNKNRIMWQMSGEGIEYIPNMFTDITLSKGDKCLIIDTKYYSHETVVHENKNLIHTNNFNQINVYVINKINSYNKINGMLLYAKTEDEIHPYVNVHHDLGYNIIVDSLDLNEDFVNIKSKINHIVNNFFNS